MTGRTFVLGVLAPLTILGCRKPTEPPLDAAPAPAASDAAIASTTARVPPPKPKDEPFTPVTGDFTTPKLHKVTCPNIPPARDPNSPEGCAKCKPNEYCKTFHSHGREFGGCATNLCTKDADCPGELCICGPPNACWPGNCRDENDCGGRECAASPMGRTSASYCRTKDDTCSKDTHCGEDQECAYEGTWKCRKRMPIPPG